MKKVLTLFVALSVGLMICCAKKQTVDQNVTLEAQKPVVVKSEVVKAEKPIVKKSKVKKSAKAIK